MPQLVPAIRKSLAILQDEGLRSLLGRALKRLWGREVVLFLEYDLRRPPPPRPPRVEVVFSWADAGKLGPLEGPDFDFSPQAIQEARDRLQRGDRCLIGYSGGSPACSLWVTFSLRELPGLRWPVGPGHAYLYKTFTLARFRGQGLNQAGLVALLLGCRELGMRRAFIDVSRANVASVAAIRKAGFIDAGRFHIWHFGRRRFARVGR
ncbi:MAG: GNAT family N-acetyltransferase, partial [Candidatus Methylomirabilales bacterium]